MSWFKKAQNKEAGLLDWINRQKNVTIPTALLSTQLALGQPAEAKPKAKPSRPVAKSVVTPPKTPPKTPAKAKAKPKAQAPATKPAKPSVPPAQRLPRGLRNNNPGNIDYNANNPWQGSIGSDGRFTRFETPEMGLRAMARTLRTYQKKYNLKTLAQIINRWAPPVENNTKSYSNRVAQDVGVNVNAPIDLNDDSILAKVMAAMIKVENGRNPYSEETILRGVQMESQK